MNMKFDEDPRIKVARKSLALSWLYFTIYVIVIMALNPPPNFFYSKFSIQEEKFMALL